MSFVAAILTETEDFDVKYQGELPSIDTAILLPSLISLTELFQQVNTREDPDHRLTISIKATSKSSWGVHLVLAGIPIAEYLFASAGRLKRLIEIGTSIFKTTPEPSVDVAAY